MAPILSPRRPTGGRPWRPEAPSPVDVWRIDLAARPAGVAAAESLLTPAERARARRGTAAVHRRRVLLRAGLRSVLGEELGLHPAAVPVELTGSGRPQLADAGAHRVDVSCSARGDVGVVALARGCRVGVDVERVAPWSAQVLDEGWLAGEEVAELLALPAWRRAAAVARCWTGKEAVLKGRGTGLFEAPATIRTPIHPPGSSAAGWRLHDVPVPEGYVATLATAAWNPAALSHLTAPAGPDTVRLRGESPQ